MEYNIKRSSSVSMFKKGRILDDGVVWDSVVKLRKKTGAQCSNSPKKRLGIRNSWIKEFSNVFSEKASDYLLETMCAERTSRQEEIAQTLLNRFNNILEQEASMTAPKTLTHEAMVVMADKLSLWLDKNVKVSKNVRTRLLKMEEEEKKKRLMEEMKRLHQEKRDREEEKKRKLAQELANKKEADLSSSNDVPPGTEPETKKPQEEDLSANKEADVPTHDEIQPPPEIEPDAQESQADKDLRLYEPEIGENEIQGTDGATTGEAQQEGQQAFEQVTEHPLPTTAESTDGTQETGGKSDYETELDGSRQILEDSPEGKVPRTVTQESDPDDNEGRDENTLASDNGGFKDVTKDQSFMEKDIPAFSPIHKVLDFDGAPNVEGTQNVERMQIAEGARNGEETEDASYPSPDVPEVLLDSIGASYQPQSEGLQEPEYSAPPSSDSEFSDRDELKAEPSKDTAILVDELLGPGTDVEDTGLVDKPDNRIEIQGAQGKSVDDEIDIQDNQDNSVNDKTNMVLHELAEMMAGTPEMHSPIQEAFKDIVEKELEERLGDRDAETIYTLAGKVGTWMDQMVERVWEEYGERRPPAAAILSQVSQQPTFIPMPVPQASFSPATVLEVPKQIAVPPEGLAEPFIGKVGSQYPLPPVSQKPKGPIFELRKVAPKNMFNVTGITNTKAKRKVREVRGQSISRPISQQSLDLEEWAEWAGLVSDVGQNWAKWIESAAQAVVRPHKSHDRWLSYDAKEWKHMSKELQREGEVWMQKAVRKQRKKNFDRSPKPVSA